MSGVPPIHMMKVLRDRPAEKAVRDGELITLLALMTALIALSIDGVLPALGPLSDDMALTSPNQRQWVLNFFFASLAVSQLFFGPVADRFGRLPTILFGILVYAVGSMICALATEFWVMLLGRILQGIGAGAPRIAANAVVRDRFEGTRMAEIMSLMMTLFILVPIFAPMVGQGIEILLGWRAIFYGMLVWALGLAVWAVMRLPETLSEEHRRPLQAGPIIDAALICLRTRSTMGYTLAMAAALAGFMGYINSTQQILQELYGLGDMFPIAFAALAFSAGICAFLNSRLVRRFGILPLIKTGLTITLMSSVGLVLVTLQSGGVPPFWALMISLQPIFFCFGLIFGNLNALAMQPMGALAGTASSIIGACTSLLAVSAGAVVGQAYDGTLFPMAFGYLVFSIIAIVATYWASAGKESAS